MKRKPISAPEIFPAASDDGCEPFRIIARHLDICADVVMDSFSGINPECWAPEHLSSVRGNTEALNEAAKHAENLHLALLRISQGERDDLTQQGCVTVQQIEHLADLLRVGSVTLSEWSTQRKREGGKNLAAHDVAEGVRRTFRRTQTNITFGQHPGGGPSTPFGRAVEVAIGAFGIRADWKSPTKAAFAKQRKLLERYARFKERTCLEHGHPLERVQLDGVKIETSREDGHTGYLISLEDLPAIRPKFVCSCRVRSGREVEVVASAFARSERAKALIPTGNPFS